MDKYIRYKINTSINVSKIPTLIYYEFDKDFNYSGESHDFWELVYVEFGELDVIEDGITYPLEAGEMYLHRPNATHLIARRNNNLVRFVIATFECYSQPMNAFRKFKFKLNKSCKNIMSNLINELHHAHNVRIKNNIYIATPFKEADMDLELLQCTRIYLELLFITLYRINKEKDKDKEKTYNDNFYVSLCNNVIVYLQENIYGKISLEELCDDLGYGKTMICKHFKNYTGKGIMEYYLDMKIQEAKWLLVSGKHNVSQISDMLMFSSPYYFTACFKRICGMSPTKYRSER